MWIAFFFINSTLLKPQEIGFFFKGREERWRTCASGTNAALGFAVAPAFVRRAGFGEESRGRAHQMMSEIKGAFKGMSF